MDPLSDVLSLLNPPTYVTDGLSASGPWSIRLPAYDGIKCYAVAAGACWVAVAGVEVPVTVRTGNCVLLPHGRPCVLASDLAIPPVDARTLLSAIGEKARRRTRAQSKETTSFVLGSHFALEGDARFLLHVLPPIVVAHQESIRWAPSRQAVSPAQFACQVGSSRDGRVEWQHARSVAAHRRPTPRLLLAADIRTRAAPRSGFQDSTAKLALPIDDAPRSYHQTDRDDWSGSDQNILGCTDHHGSVPRVACVNVPVGPSGPSSATRTASRAPSSTVSTP